MLGSKFLDEVMRIVRSQPWTAKEVFMKEDIESRVLALYGETPQEYIDPDMKALVDNFPWNGSWFPKEKCFDQLKAQVDEWKHGELLKAIEFRANEHNSTLEG